MERGGGGAVDPRGPSPALRGSPPALSVGLLSVLDTGRWGVSSRAGLAPDHSCLSPSLHSPCLGTPGWSCSPSRPNLVSLDLSFNDLTDLQGLIASLSTLPHLRVLVLQGNPLALVPYYRGFTIDSLSRLCVLDDVTVSPSEKHQFRGLSHSGDLLAREAQLVVTIGNVKGVLDTSVLDPEPGPQGPFISYSYYVTYDFVEDEEGERSTHGGVLAEIVKPSPSAEQLGEDIPEELFGEAEDSPESGLSSQSGELEESGASDGSGHLPRVTDSAEELAKLRPRIDPRLCPSPGTVLFSTVRKPWTDVITCHYEMHHTLRDLVPLKAFLLAGTTVTIVEEKILSWPPVPPPVDAVLSTKSGKGEKDKKGQKDKDKKGKDQKDKAGKAEKETVPRSRRRPRRRSFLRSSGRTRPSCGCWAAAWWPWSPCWWGSHWCPKCATSG
ncbi:unnamed protein product [Gulo gulo]|uniref:Leucine-rich repeat-containing protein 43 n=1 Tax=Gulo gulo TaxID=48420 RepID=A0A9X9Q123_GULGU|nr:unnamed protein product [Gulo gulo]